ncbi:ubiquinol-cytochrome C reductase cytochrome b subunit, partial [Amycolatopsis vancoresmycina DSM 44592]
MSSLTTPTKGSSPVEKALGEAANNADQRYRLAKGPR